MSLQKAEFGAARRGLMREVGPLADQFEALWLARNKPSRMVDVMVEFERLAEEYQKFTR